MDSGDVIAERYRLEAKIGEGGMAAIWRATDTRLDRPVAIKFLFMRGRDPDAHREAVEAFRREAKIAAAVRHRNVVEVLDFGTSGDDVPFMVMEVLEGASLGAMMDDEHPFTVGEVIKIMGLTLQGLMAVHAAGIVHRDLKPENIFLLKDRAGYYPKLVDFGISKSLDASEGRASAIKTQEGLFVGTPMYMSSEQARGIPDIDARTDVYSLGVIMYELLSGEPPYATEHVGDLLVRIMNGGAPPLIERAPRVGKPISDVIARAMQVDRDARFATAEEMYDALMSAAGRVGDATGSLSLPPPRPSTDQATPEGRSGAVVATLQLPAAPSAIVPAGGAQAAIATVQLPAAPTASAPTASAPTASAGAGKRGWAVAAFALLLGGAGIGYGVFAGQQPTDTTKSRYIVVETPKTAVAAAGTDTDPEAEPETEAEAEPETETETETETGTKSRAKAAASRPKPHRKPTSAAGRLSQSFADQQAKLAPCLDGAAGAAGGMPKLSIRFSIDAGGHVLSTRLSPEDFRSSPVGRCLEKRARDIRFEKQPGPIAFNIPLRARVGG